MCLISKTSIPKVASEDIEVYKRVVIKSKRKCINHHYVHGIDFTTPYTDVKIPKFPYEFIAEGKERIKEVDKNLYEIRGGFIHAYTNFLSICRNIHWDWELIVKGIIPKDIKYYVGNEGDICAKKIYLQGIIRVGEKDKFCKDIIKYHPNIPIFDINSITSKRVNPTVFIETVKPVVEELITNKIKLYDGTTEGFIDEFKRITEENAKKNRSLF